MNNVAKSEFPPNFIPAEAKPFSSYDDSKRGEDDTVVVKGFILPNGEIHIQEIKTFAFVY